MRQPGPLAQANENRRRFSCATSLPEGAGQVFGFLDEIAPTLETEKRQIYSRKSTEYFRQSSFELGNSASHLLYRSGINGPIFRRLGWSLLSSLLIPLE
jgi:hypothetical protein